MHVQRERNSPSTGSRHFRGTHSRLLSVACTYSASGTHPALVRCSSKGYLHIRQQSPLASGAPRDKLGMREPPAPGVPRAVTALHPPRADPRAHGPRCACVPVAGGGGVGVQRACSPEGRTAGDSCTRRCYQLPCHQLPCPRDSMCAARASHPRRAGRSPRICMASVGEHYARSLPLQLSLRMCYSWIRVSTRQRGPVPGRTSECRVIRRN
jgi:hypothetical protein